MKVILCLNHFLPYQVAGTEVYVWALGKQLQLLGCDVTVVIPNYDVDYPDSYTYNGIPVYRYAEPSRSGRAFITGHQLPEGVKNFSSWIDAQKPDIVHFHEVAGSTGMGLAHFYAAKTTGAKIVFTMHLANSTCGTSTLMYKGRELCSGVIDQKKCARCLLIKQTGSTVKSEMLTQASSLLYRLGVNPLKWQNSLGTALSYTHQVEKIKNNFEQIVSMCDMVIPITQWYHDVLLKNGVPENKMQVILQAIPTEYKPVLHEWKETKRPVRIIFIGRISSLKGIPLLIDAAKQFSEDELQLDIYGTTNDIGFLEASKSQTAAFAHIRWLGKLAQDEVVETLSRYDALVLPSTFSEMSPLVIQEAFAAKVPVIGSNVYGIAEQIKDEHNGLLFQFADKKSLVDVFKKVVHHPSVLSGMKKNISAPRQFKEVAAETYNVYQKLIKKTNNEL